LSVCILLIAVIKWNDSINIVSSYQALFINTLIKLVIFREYLKILIPMHHLFSFELSHGRRDIQRSFPWITPDLADELVSVVLFKKIIMSRESSRMMIDLFHFTSFDLDLPLNIFCCVSSYPPTNGSPS